MNFMNDNLVYSLKDITEQEISIYKFVGTADNVLLYSKPAHRRNDHFLFIFQKSGKSKIVVDFKDIELAGSVAMCVCPGQLHYTKAIDNDTEAWLIILAADLVNDKYRAIFENAYFHYEPLALQSPVNHLLNECIHLMAAVHENRIQSELLFRVEQSLIDACVGMFAHACLQIENKKKVLSRKQVITRQFKHLLFLRYRTHNSPADYAGLLNISPSYLNEAVKRTTGFPVSFWIEQVIMTEAKRLLYATDNPVKEIAYSLGFDDHAYFTRYFTRAEGRAPLQFRASYRK